MDEDPKSLEKALECLAELRRWTVSIQEEHRHAENALAAERAKVAKLRDVAQWLIDAMDTGNDPRVILTIASEMARAALAETEEET